MAASPDLHTQRSPGAGGRRLAEFWRWWRGEIARMLPDSFAAMGGATPLLLIEGDEAVAIDPHGSLDGAERRVNLPAQEEGRRAAVRSLLESVGETRGRARAVVRHDEALVRRATLPAATEENLAQVLAFEMDRLSPFRADEVYFDQRVMSRDPGNGQIVVELAMSRREAVDRRVRELRDLGVSVQGVALRDDARRAATPFDLLPSEQRGERETRRERLVRTAMIGAVALLFAATLVYPVWKKREAVLELLPIVEKARQEAQATDAIVRELDRQAADYNYLLARKHAWYPTAAYLEEVSRLLPDNTWIMQLDIKSLGKTKEILLNGEAASSSKLIELLEQSKMLQNTSPRGATTRGSLPNTERFMIGAELKSRTPPEAQPLSTPPKGSQPTAASAPVGSPAAPVSTLPSLSTPPKAPPPPAASAPGFGPAPPVSNAPPPSTPPNRPPPNAASAQGVGPAPPASNTPPPPANVAPPQASPNSGGFGPFPRQ